MTLSQFFQAQYQYQSPLIYESLKLHQYNKNYFITHNTG